MGELGRMLLVSGLAIALLGVLFMASQAVPWLKIGNLPGDIRIERPGYSFYFPLTTMLLLSAIASVAFWAYTRLRR